MNHMQLCFIMQMLEIIEMSKKKNIYFFLEGNAEIIQKIFFFNLLHSIFHTNPISYFNLETMEIFMSEDEIIKDMILFPFPIDYSEELGYNKPDIIYQALLDWVISDIYDDIENELTILLDDDCYSESDILQLLMKSIDNILIKYPIEDIYDKKVKEVVPAELAVNMFLQDEFDTLLAYEFIQRVKENRNIVRHNDSHLVSILKDGLIAGLPELTIRDVVTVMEIQVSYSIHSLYVAKFPLMESAIKWLVMEKDCQETKLLKYAISLLSVPTYLYDKKITIKNGNYETLEYVLLYLDGDFIILDNTWHNIVLMKIIRELCTNLNSKYHFFEL